MRDKNKIVPHRKEIQTTPAGLPQPPFYLVSLYRLSHLLSYRKTKAGVRKRVRKKVKGKVSTADPFPFAVNPLEFPAQAQPLPPGKQAKPPASSSPFFSAGLKLRAHLLSASASENRVSSSGALFLVGKFSSRYCPSFTSPANDQTRLKYSVSFKKMSSVRELGARKTKKKKEEVCLPPRLLLK